MGHSRTRQKLALCSVSCPFSARVYSMSCAQLSSRWALLSHFAASAVPLSPMMAYISLSSKPALWRSRHGRTLPVGLRSMSGSSSSV